MARADQAAGKAVLHVADNLLIGTMGCRLVVQHGAGLVVPPRTGPPPGSGPPWPGTQHFFLDLDPTAPPTGPTPQGCLLAACSP